MRKRGLKPQQPFGSFAQAPRIKVEARCIVELFYWLADYAAAMAVHNNGLSPRRRVRDSKSRIALYGTFVN